MSPMSRAESQVLTRISPCLSASPTTSQSVLFTVLGMVSWSTDAPIRQSRSSHSIRKRKDARRPVTKQEQKPLTPPLHLSPSSVFQATSHAASDVLYATLPSCCHAPEPSTVPRSTQPPSAPPSVFQGPRPYLSPLVSCYSSSPIAVAAAQISHGGDLRR